MSLRGDGSRGARRTAAPGGARRGPSRSPGVLQTHGTDSGADQGGTNGTLPDNRLRTCRKGAAGAAPFQDLEWSRGQSSSQDTEALSAAGAVVRRSARIPRAPTVWTVDSRMARSRLTDEVST